jgi:hypothetical protein
VDVAAGCVRDGVESLHVIEVKGSLADLSREDVEDGKWLLPYPRLSLNPWLAHADAIGPGHLESLPRAWGLLSVAVDGRVRVTREPEHIVDSDANQPDDNVTNAYRALAQVLTAQALPTLYGTDLATAMSLLSERGVDRPWRAWAPRIDVGSDDDNCREDVEGNIL